MPRGIYARKPRIITTANDAASVEPITGAADPQATQDTPKPLSTRIAKQIDGIRETFNGYTNGLKLVNERRADFAPKFMKVFNAWKDETQGNFVAFVRVLVPDLPMQRAGYIVHPAHVAADNLRSLYNRLERARKRTPAEQAQAEASKPVAPRQASLRLVASFLPYLEPSALDALKKVMKEQLHWSDNVVETFVAEATEATPLLRVRVPRGVHIEHALKVTPGPVPVSEPASVAA